jgi:hypothetical protein
MNSHPVMERNTLRVRLRRWWRRVVPWLLEDQAHQGLGGPPNNWQSTGPIIVERNSKGAPWHEMYARFGNDAHEIMIGHTYIEDGKRDQAWIGSIPTATFRQMAIWYLWRWAWGEWFGLRRRLFYWNLFRKVDGLKAWRAAMGPRPEKDSDQ